MRKTDGQDSPTGMTKLIVTFLNFANATKKINFTSQTAQG